MDKTLAPHFTVHVVTYPFWYLSKSQLVNRAPGVQPVWHFNGLHNEPSATTMYSICFHIIKGVMDSSGTLIHS